MGEEGGAAADYQAMLKKVQETNFHTSEEEQGEVERAGWDIHFPPNDRFMAQANADIRSFEEQLHRRAASERMGQPEIEQRVVEFSVQRYERAMRQLMALYDLWKKKHFPMFVENLYSLSVAIDGVEQALKDKKAELGL